MKSKLTPKQEKFIQNIVSGMSQREAYKNSYNASKMKDESIDTKAWELMQKVEIKERYQELLNKLEDEAIMSAKERMIWLTNVVNGEIKDTVYYNVNGVNTPIEKVADISTKIKAVDTLNKMSGEYKTILDGSVGVTKKLEDLL